MMQDITLNFGVSGEARKKLVKAVSAYKSVPSEYLGVPSFAFRVDEMIIDRDGVLVIEGGMEDEELRGFLEYLRGKGFQADHAIPHQGDAEEAVAESVTEDETVAKEAVITEAAVSENPIDETAAADAPEDNNDETATATEDDGMEAAVTEDPTGKPVIMEAVDEPVTDDAEEGVLEVGYKPVTYDPDVTVKEENVSEDVREETVVEHTVEEATADDPEEVAVPEDDGETVAEGEEPLLTIQIPREGFTDQSLATLQLIIKSKEHLLKKSLDTDDLGILITDDRISFPWFQKNDPVSTSAYMHLVTAICDMAQRAKRVSVTERVPGTGMEM